MIQMKMYWCENVPTLEDIQQAYAEVANGYVVSMNWAVAYSGAYKRIITKDTVENYPDCADYLEKRIPHIYGV